MSDSRRRTGRRGEEIAAHYFLQRDYTILHRNWRCPAGELDIVLQKDETIIFVEVRTRTSTRYGSPEESITPAKQQRLIELAHLYLQENSPPHRHWRIDVVAIAMRHGRPWVNHLENAVGW
ncbi:MAG: hypothetical protein FOGNACKC_01539 [Anaerolineae bacterium]|nr:hypothetical protein [Anaerolineae bacterium]